MKLFWKHTFDRYMYINEKIVSIKKQSVSKNGTTSNDDF